MRVRCVMFSLSLILFLSFAFAQESQRGLYIVRLGNDTVAVESYEMNAQSIRGTSVSRTPQTTSRSYALGMNDRGSLEYFDVGYGPVGGMAGITRNLRYFDDSVDVAITQNGTTNGTMIKVSGRPYPFIADIIGPWNFAIRNSFSGKGPKEFSILTGTRILRYEIRGTSPGILELVNPSFGPIYATVDANGRLDKFDMTRTTDKFIVERVDQLDIQAVAQNFMERESVGAKMGTLSPRDTVRATIDGATVMIDYGRPALRGRKIFGNVVPWNVVWRLGANAATQLTTDKALQFGSTTIEPGTYSLFAHPSERTWMLIVNRQHGQWGTMYDQSKDFVRLPLKTEHSEHSVERLTFRIDKHGNSGILEFEWENTKASALFEVR